MIRFAQRIAGLLLVCGLAADGGGIQAQTPVASSPPVRIADQRPGSPPRTVSPLRPPVAHQTPAVTLSTGAVSPEALVDKYCVTCHNDRTKAGDMSLAAFAAWKDGEHGDTVERMIRKLRAGMMPPSGAARPDEATLEAFAAALEARMDALAVINPNPGWRPFQRLTRGEYQRAVNDLLDVDVDVTPFLPPDTMSHGFDNLADAQSMSPALLQGYLRAASQITRLAIGDRLASATSATYRIPATESQMRYVEGAPFGSRGGLSIVHTFAADGTYTFTFTLVRSASGELYGNTSILLAGRNELIDVSIDGERVALLEVDKGMGDESEKGMIVKTPPIHVRSGSQQVSAVFVPRFAGPVDDLIAPIDQTLIDTRIGTGFGITALPHLQDMTIAGPLQVTGISDTPSRRRIFTCRPTAAEERCATQILENLGSKAYRGPLSGQDLGELMKFYEQGRLEGGDFEAGIQMAVQAILANPRFVFRVEPVPKGATGAFNIGGLDLASRLSFFLWGTVPDVELIRAANAGALRTRAGIERQVRRMLADRRSESLSKRFWSQWLRLQDIDKVRPDGVTYPQWDASLSASFRRETELFFDHLIREDRSVLDLLTADYTFVDERLARHYGFANVQGTGFRRVTLPAYRRGILTQGSTLLLTSVADRTSPVQRGKWVMQVLLGSPPPPPPPNVPTLDNTKPVADGKLLTVRQRMEQHRSSPSCSSCHRVIDPIGLALENFDPTGQYRIKDNGVPVDARGQLYDGTVLDGPSGLISALMKRKTAVLTTFTESLATYAVGRRLEYYDMAAVRAIVRAAAPHDYKLSSLIVGVATSPMFRMARVPSDTDDGGANHRSAVPVPRER